MRNALPIGIRPRSSYVPLEPAVNYLLREGTGTTLSDKLGNGGSLTVTGTTGYWANAGWFTPQGDNQLVTADAAIIAALNIGLYPQVLIGIDFYFASDIADSEHLLGVGDTSDNTEGGITVVFSAAEQWGVVARGLGSSSLASAAITGTDMSAFNNIRNALLFDLREDGMSIYRQGSLMGSSAFTWGSGSTGVPSAFSSATLFGWGHGDSSTKPLGSASSGARVANLFIHARSSAADDVATSIARDLWRYPGENPIAAAA